MVSGISTLGIHGYRRNLTCDGSYKFRAALNSAFSNPSHLAQAIMDAGQD